MLAKDGTSDNIDERGITMMVMVTVMVIIIKVLVMVAMEQMW